MRLIKELKQKLSDSYLGGRYSIQHEFIPLVLDQILAYLKQGEIPALLQYLDDFSVTNEMVKEHLLGLTMDRSMQA